MYVCNVRISLHSRSVHSLIEGETRCYVLSIRDSCAVCICIREERKGKTDTVRLPTGVQSNSSNFIYYLCFDLSFSPRNIRFVFVILLRLYIQLLLYTIHAIIIIELLINWCYGYRSGSFTL